MTMMDRYTLERAYDREDWLAQRQPYFNASAAACLWDRHPYESAADYATKKLTGVDNDDETSAMRRGNYLEDGVAEWWAFEDGVTVIEPGVLYACGPVLATVDRWDITRDRPVEIKTASGHHSEPQDYWLDQCQAIMLCADRDVIELVWMDGSLDLASMTVDADEVQQRDLMNRAERFMAAIELGMVPDWIIPQLKHRHVAALNPEPVGEVELDEATVDLMFNYRDLKLRVKEAEVEMDAIKDVVAGALGGHEVGLWDGTKIVSWKPSKSLDKVGLTEAHPELVAEYTVEKPGARRFLPSGI